MFLLQQRRHVLTDTFNTIRNKNEYVIIIIIIIQTGAYYFKTSEYPLIN